jgi:hypothetical protein
MGKSWANEDVMDTLLDKFPPTVEKAVEKLILDMSFADKTRLANMDDATLATFHRSYGIFIRSELRLPGNDPLMKSCKTRGYVTSITPEQASYVILKELQKQLIAGNTLKVVK